MLGGLFGRHRHGHIIGDHDDLGLQIDAVVLADHLHRIMRPQELGAGGLIHQRIHVKGLGHLGIARPAHALDVRQVGAAVDELIGARQRRRQIGQIQFEHPVRLARLQRLGHRIQARRDIRPAIQRLLQGARNRRHFHRALEITRDHDQRAITAAAFERCEFHGETP